MPVCEETRNRIRLAVAAYAYEFLADPIMSDADFDALANQIDPSKETGSPREDAFFRDHFDPHTGSWIHKHPNPGALDMLYQTYYRPGGRIPVGELREIEELI